MKKTLTIIMAALIMAAASAVLSGCGEEAQVQSADTSTVSSSTSENSSTDKVSQPTEEKTENATQKNEKDDKSSSNSSSSASNSSAASNSEDKNSTASQSDNKSSSGGNTNTSGGLSASSSNNSGASTQTTTTNNGSAGNNNSNTNKNTNTNTNTSKPSTVSNSTTSKPSSGTTNKTYHEAVYKTVNHPAETKKVWVVDKAAYTYEEPVYEEHDRTICNTCGADITDCLTAHGKAHVLNGENASYHNEWIEIQVGTKTVTVPEQGHWETKVVKAAWTEKVLVREAGWY